MVPPLAPSLRLDVADKTWAPAGLSPAPPAIAMPSSMQKKKGGHPKAAPSPVTNVGLVEALPAGSVPSWRRVARAPYVG